MADLDYNDANDSANDSTVDWSDPCQRFAALQKAYFALLSGEREIEIRTRTLDAEELVRFERVNLDDLRVELRNAESACARANGQADPNRRFAIGLGYRRRGYPPGYDPSDPRG